MVSSGVAWRGGSDMRQNRWELIGKGMILGAMILCISFTACAEEDAAEIMEEVLTQDQDAEAETERFVEEGGALAPEAQSDQFGMGETFVEVAEPLIEDEEWVADDPETLVEAANESADGGNGYFNVSESPDVIIVIEEETEVQTEIVYGTPTGGDEATQGSSESSGNTGSSGGGRPVIGGGDETNESNNTSAGGALPSTGQKPEVISKVVVKGRVTRTTKTTTIRAGGSSTVTNQNIAPSSTATKKTVSAKKTGTKTKTTKTTTAKKTGNKSKTKTTKTSTAKKTATKSKSAKTTASKKTNTKKKSATVSKSKKKTNSGKKTTEK